MNRKSSLMFDVIAGLVIGGIFGAIGLSVFGDSPGLKRFQDVVLKNSWNALPFVLAGGAAVLYFKHDLLQREQRELDEQYDKSQVTFTFAATVPQSQPVGVTAQSWDQDEEDEQDQAIVPAATIEPQPVTPAAVTATAHQWDNEPSESYDWMQDLLGYPTILIWGAQGSGKTTLAEWLMYERVKMGHKAEILDPHRKFGQWEGLQVYGDGMDYDAIDRRLEAFAKLVKKRYQERSQKPDFNPQPITVLAEEFTNWSKRCDHSAAFFETSLSDIRKINAYAVYVSHGRTLALMGGSKGTAETRDKSLIEVELIAYVHPETKKAFPTGKGMIRYPDGRLMNIVIPDLSKPNQQPQNTPADLREQLEKTFASSPNDEPPTLAASAEQHVLIAQDALNVHEWALKQDKPVSARDIQRANIATVKGYSADQIRGLFVLLERSGKGRTNGVESEMTYSPIDS